MANCKSCGRELTSTGSDMCPDCVVAAMMENQAPVRVRRAMPVGSSRPVTTVLLGINLAVFVGMLLTGVSLMEPTTQQLLKWGANWGPLSLGGEPWRIITANYVHAGILHIAFNMWCLWDLGGLAERVFERTTYILVYVACGIGGSLASLWWHPLVTGVGASGAIFGLAGAVIAAFYLGNLPFPKNAMQATMRSLLIFAGYNLFFGAVSARTDNSAHVGGLVTGLVCGALLARHLASPRELRVRWTQGILAGVAVILFSMFVLVKKANGQVADISQAVDAVQGGRVDEGIQDLERILRKTPDDPMSLTLLGGLYLDKHDYAKAEGLFQRAATSGPKNFSVLYGLGVAQLMQGKQDQAIPNLENAARLDSSNSDAQQALGEAYRAKGETDKANAALQKAEALRKADK